MVRDCIAIIPARGGSRRIPQKNIIEFMGRPMIEWTIEAARESDCFEHIVVSTDDQTIARVARECGAEVPFLRVEHFDDYSSVSQATVAALRQAEDHWGRRFRAVAQLMPNCPLRKASHIKAAIQEFFSKGHVYQISCVQFGWMNPWWALRMDDEGRPEYLFPDMRKMRSQDLPPLYAPTGAIWIAERTSLLDAGTFYGPGHRYFTLEWTAGIDIDDMDDLKMAIAVAQMDSLRR